MRFGRWLGWLTLSAAVLGGGSCRTDPPSNLGEVRGSAFGTTWALKWRGEADAAALRTLVEGMLEEREAAFSHWREDSEVSRFNRSDSLEWQPVSAAVVRAVAVTKAVADETDGALDITVGPLVDLWGFGSGDRAHEPSETEIDECQKRCGWRWLEVRTAPPALRKLRPDVGINLSSVAEGVAMDEIVAKLVELGIEHFLFEFGGEVVGRGEPVNGRPWKVGVQSPGGLPGETLQRVELRDACVATAGTYRQKRTTDNGREVSHLIDPRNGRPIDHDLTSVTVLHESCARADAYATALLVLGQDQGKAAAERLGLRVIWIVRE